MKKVTLGHLVVRKLENLHIFTHSDFSAAKLERNKCANYTSKYGIGSKHVGDNVSKIIQKRVHFFVFSTHVYYFC
jgi:hypothetical protein